MLEIKPKKEGDIEAAARFRFESGPLATSDYIGTASICDQPTCRCDLVHFKLAPKEGTDPEVSFALELQDQKVYDQGNTGGKGLSFARHMARSLTKNEWLDLQALYSKVKEEITETADIQKVPVYLNVDHDNSVLWYRDFMPHAAPFRFSMDGKPIDAFDAYCSNPKCSCTEVFLTFGQPGANHQKNQSDNCEVGLSYQEHKLSRVVHESKKPLAQPQALIDAMVQDIPDFWQKAQKRRQLPRPKRRSLLEEILQALMWTRLSKKGGFFLSYVRNQYIGTLGCFTSPRLCGKGLNKFKGLSQCSLHLKRFHNIAKVTFTWVTRERGGNSPC